MNNHLMAVISVLTRLGQVKKININGKMVKAKVKSGKDIFSIEINGSEITKASGIGFEHSKAKRLSNFASNFKDLMCSFEGTESINNNTLYYTAISSVHPSNLLGFKLIVPEDAKDDINLSQCDLQIFLDFQGEKVRLTMNSREIIALNAPILSENAITILALISRIRNSF